MKELQFYDLKAKQLFKTTDYTIEAKQTKKGLKYLARTTRESGQKCCKMVNKTAFEEYMSNK